MLKIAIERVAGGHGEFRERVLDLVQLEIAAFGDGQGALEHVLAAVEEARHLVRALDEKLGAVELEPVRVIHRLAGLHADQHVLRVRVIFTEIMAVIGGHHGDAQLFFQADEIAVDAMLLGQALVLYLHEEIVRAKELAIEAGRAARGFILVGQQVFADLASQAAAQGDQPFCVLGQEFLADARLVVEAVHAGFRGDLDQVAIAFFILGQHQQVVVGIAFRRSAMVILLADIKFASDNRLDALLLRLFHELHRAVDVAVVGHGHGLLPDLGHPLDQAGNAASAVEQRIVGMKMKMDEFSHGRFCYT